MLSKRPTCFLKQGLHIQLVMSAIVEKDGTFDPLDTLLLRIQGPSSLAIPLPDLKRHQLELSVKIKQPRKHRAISRNANPGPNWSRLDNFCTLWKQKCKVCLRNSWGESNQEDNSNKKE